MNPGKPAHETMTNTGTFIGNAVFGRNNKVDNNTITVGDVQASASIDDLRNAIAAARDELVGAAEDPEAQAEVRYEIRKIEQELTEEEPRGVVVRSRWEQVAKVLDPLVVASNSVAQITELITKVFNGG